MRCKIHLHLPDLPVLFGLQTHILYALYDLKKLKTVASKTVNQHKKERKVWCWSPLTIWLSNKNKTV